MGGLGVAHWLEKALSHASLVHSYLPILRNLLFLFFLKKKIFFHQLLHSIEEKSIETIRGSKFVLTGHRKNSRIMRARRLRANSKAPVQILKREARISRQNGRWWILRPNMHGNIPCTELVLINLSLTHSHSLSFYVFKFFMWKQSSLHSKKRLFMA